MKNLVYLSTSVGLMTDEDLLQILTTARKRNKEQNVSGVLLYFEGTFIQVLEGEDESVDEIYSLIAQDTRHKNIVLMMDEPLQKRNFPEWHMGFATIDPAISEEFVESFTSTNKILSKDSNDTAIMMLKAFIESNKLVINN